MYKVRYIRNGKTYTSVRSYRTKTTARKAINKAKRATRKGNISYSNLRIVKKR